MPHTDEKTGATTLTAPELDTALVTWETEEIKQHTARTYDLGKFMLTTCGANITLLTALTTLVKPSFLTGAWWSVAVAMVMQLFAAYWSLDLIIPKREKTSDDLLQRYKDRVDLAHTRGRVWVALWFLSVLTVGAGFIWGRT